MRCKELGFAVGAGLADGRLIARHAGPPVWSDSQQC
jgi:hypothetical protein